MKKILKLSTENEAKIDSTPREASRYDKHADYNPHYECKMDKARITMVGTYPVFMTHSNGLASDMRIYGFILKQNQSSLTHQIL